MRAERRVAEAALDAARAQLARTEQERAAARGSSWRRLATAPSRARARRMPRPSALRPRGALAAAEARRVEAEQGRAAAAEARDAAESRLASARAALSAARSEHDALARALDHGGGAAIASLKAEPGYERALAAALGEDADAAIGGDGPRRWQGSGRAAERSRRCRRAPNALPIMSTRAGGAAAPAAAGRGRRRGRRAGARGRPAAGHARRTAAPLGRLRRDRRRARPRPSGCCGPTGSPQLAADLPALEQRGRATR